MRSYLLSSAARKMSYDHNDFTNSDDDFIRDLVATGFILAELDESHQQGGEDPQSSSHGREDANEPLTSTPALTPTPVVTFTLTPTLTLPQPSSPTMQPATVASFAPTAPLGNLSPIHPSIPMAPGQLPYLSPSPALTPSPVHDDDTDDKENAAAPLLPGPQARLSDKGKRKEVTTSLSPLPTPPARPAKRCRADNAGGSNADQVVSCKRARRETDRPALTSPEPEALDEDRGNPCPYLVSRHSQLTCGLRGCSEVLEVSGLSPLAPTSGNTFLVIHHQASVLRVPADPEKPLSLNIPTTIPR
ncbi:hypothetical protein BD309DRAFT_414223 [Dichomitus squalens]|nr:hypothetical protein BD309DRAFT_414223 [Dichomitus squalens]